MKKAISLLLALTLCLGLLPAAVFAEEDETTDPDTSVTDPGGTPEEPEEPQTPVVTMTPESGSTLYLYLGEKFTTTIQVTNDVPDCTFNWGLSYTPGQDKPIAFAGEPRQTATSCSQEWIVQSGGVVEIDFMVNGESVGEITVKALSVTKGYTISFDSNGSPSSSFMPPVLGVKDGYRIPENVYTAPSGKEFKCWATRKDGSGETYQPGDTFHVTNDITFYAIWQDIPNQGGDTTDPGTTPENPGTTPETPSGDLIENARMYLWTTNYREPMDSPLNVGLYDSSNTSVSVHLKTTEGLPASRRPIIRWIVEDDSVARIYEKSYEGPKQARKTVDVSLNSTGLLIGDPSVVICPRKTGTTRITAQIYEIHPAGDGQYFTIGEVALSFTLTVTEGDVPRITVTPQNVTLKTGEKKEITVTLSEGQFGSPWLIFPEAGAIEKLINIDSKNSKDNRTCTLTLEGKAPGTADLNLYLSKGTGAAIPSTKQVCRVTVTGGQSVVSFDSNGGSNVSNKTVTVGGTYGSLPTPTRENYTFTGWYTSRTGGTEVTSSTTVTNSSNHTLYARWVQTKQVTVSFNSNGGGSVSSKTVTTGKQYGTLPTPTREGYAFDGWYTSSTGGSEVTSSTTVTNEYNHTLYAHWIEANGKLTVSPGSVSFNSAKEGYAQPAAQTVTVNNTGSTSITLAQPSSSSFELGSLSRTSLSANASATFTIRPKAGLKAGTYSETFSVKSTDGKTAASVSVSFIVTAETTAPSSTSFTDLSAGAYYYEPVLWAMEKGVTSGTSATTFSPDITCTRGQVVTFLHRVKGSPDVQGENPFRDVPSSSFYLKPVLWAVENGITSGTSATTFSPDAPCTRAHVVTFLWNAAGRPEPENSTSQFTDVQDSSAYYYKAVLWAVENGITSGTSATTFSPNAACTRAHVVTFLHRAYQ